MIKECTPGGVRICNNSIILPKTCAQHFRENYPVIVAINYLCVGVGEVQTNGQCHNMI